MKRFRAGLLGLALLCALLCGCEGLLPQAGGEAVKLPADAAAGLQSAKERALAGEKNL